MILVARAFFSTREFSQIAENIQLMMGHLDALLEKNPGDALVARRCRQRSQVRPITIVIYADNRLINVNETTKRKCFCKFLRPTFD